MASSDDSPMAGIKVGQFIIENELDRGGYGIVYRALNPAGGAVALKILHPELAKNIEITRRFEREIRVVTLIGHPNVIQILDVGATDEGTPFFAMELLEGIDLRRHVRSQGRLTLEEMFGVLEPLVGALTASHSKGVIHRDLKPSNVFLADRVVLLDFGIAKLMEDTGTRITSSRHVVGTPPSMAPEQIVAGDIDERTDVYALGALVFFMLTARMPFVHSSIAQLLDLQLRAPAPPTSRFAPVSAALDAVIAKALAKSRTDRQVSVAKFFAEMQTAMRSDSKSSENSENFEKAAAIVRDATNTAVHIELRAPAGVAEWDDDELDAMEAALPTVASVFTKMNFGIAAQTGNSRLFLHPHCTVEDAMKAAESAIEPFSAAAFSFHVHVTSGSPKTLDTVSTWVPSISEPGVHVV